MSGLAASAPWEMGVPSARRVCEDEDACMLYANESNEMVALDKK